MSISAAETNREVEPRHRLTVIGSQAQSYARLAFTYWLARMALERQSGLRVNGMLLLATPLTGRWVLWVTAQSALTPAPASTGTIAARR